MTEMAILEALTEYQDARASPSLQRFPPESVSRNYSVTQIFKSSKIFFL